MKLVIETSPQSKEWGHLFMKTAIKEKTSKYRETNREYYLNHKEDILTKSKKYYQDNIEYIKQYKKEKNIREETYRIKNLGRFGISVDEYDIILNRQNGVCAVCKNPCITGRRLAVDHNHKTNTVRGLLCSRCNMSIGLMRDNILLLKQSITYLEGSI